MVLNIPLLYQSESKYDRFVYAGQKERYGPIDFSIPQRLPLPKINSQSRFHFHTEIWQGIGKCV